MPITQSRMLSLLAAAQDYAEAMERLWSISAETRNRVDCGEITHEAGFNLLAISIRPELMLRYPYESPAVLKLEAKHFALEKRRNERKAEKAREDRARANAGLPPLNRGTGKEHGWKGANSRGKGRAAGVLSIRPDTEMTMPRAARVDGEDKTTTRPVPRTLSENEILANAGLDDMATLGSDFTPAPTPSTPFSIPQEAQLDQAAKYRVQKELDKADEDAAKKALEDFFKAGSGVEG